MAKKSNDKSDFMSREMDARVEQLEERLTALYVNAANEIKSEYTDFMAIYEKEDNAKREQVEAGQMQEDEYLNWRRTQILKSNQYTKAVESMTNMLVKTDVAAMAMVDGELPSVVAESYDFVEGLGFQAAEEQGLPVGTFQIYNAESVQALIRDNPDLMPAPKVDIAEDKKWNKDRINREITQGIVQGKSISKIAEGLQRVTTMDKNAAIRNARTAMTGAENLGRSEAAADLKEKGIPTQEVWSATYDDRVRDTHLLMDGTTRDENGFFGSGIVNIPLRFPGDPQGEPGEVYNCRCRLNIVLQGIDHSQDRDLYEKFMKENYPEDYEALKESDTEKAREEARERALERQAELREAGITTPEAAAAEEKEPETIKEPEAESLPAASELLPAEDLNSGSREVVQGKDLTGTWSRRDDEFEFAIDDVLNAQGFNGLPKVVTEEEFDKAVAESGFIAQRTYAAPDKETLDAYRDQLYNGDWYVNCETGGAQYGQGMYCAADYTGQLTEGIKAEMAHYQELGGERYGTERSNEERKELAIEEAKNRGIEITESVEKYIDAQYTGDFAKMFEAQKEVDPSIQAEINSINIPVKVAESYTETLTLTSDANIITYNDLQDMARKEEEQEQQKYVEPAIEELLTQNGIENDPNALTYLKFETGTGDVSWAEATEAHEILEQQNKLADIDKLIPEANKTTQEALQKGYEEAKESQEKYNDLGVYAAMKGYDAINAEGHGESGSYTVILNRTKVIFKGE